VSVRRALALAAAALLAELSPDRVGRIADTRNDGCKALLRNPEFLGPLANFVILMQADAGATLRATVL